MPRHLRKKNQQVKPKYFRDEKILNGSGPENKSRRVILLGMRWGPPIPKTEDTWFDIVLPGQDSRVRLLVPAGGDPYAAV